jgi:hypothetical protein
MTPYVLGLDAPFVCPQITHHILKQHNCAVVIYRVTGGRERRMGNSDIVVRRFPEKH